MERNCLEKYGAPPHKPVIDKFRDSGFYVLDTIEKHTKVGNKGYADWKPMLQSTPVDFDTIEMEIGVSLHPQIKSFLSTYWFLALRGDINGADIGIDAITPDIDFFQYIRYRFNNNDFHYINDLNYIMIGSAEIGFVDSYLLEVNNDTGEVFAVEVMEKNPLNLQILLWNYL